MIVGERLRQLREEIGLSQGDIEKTTGLLRCYISRVENGHTVPSVETLEKFARALRVPMYRLFYDGKVPARIKAVGKPEPLNDVPEIKEIRKLRMLLAKMDDRSRNLLLHTAQNMARRKRAA